MASNVTTRTQPGLAQEATAPGTPTSARSSRSGINDCFARVCRLFQVTLPFHDNTSPSKQSGSLKLEVVKKIRYCYFRDYHALDRVVVELSGYTPTVRSSPGRLNVLDKRLGELVRVLKEQPTPKSVGSSRRWPPTPLAALDEDADGEPPPSPTLAVKHVAGQLPVPIAVDGDGAPSEHLPTEISRTHPFAATVAITSETTTAVTSFMSDSTRLDKSFMSDATKLSQSTAATMYSASVASKSTQTSEFPMSSIASSEVGRLESQALAHSSRLADGVCNNSESKEALQSAPSTPPSPSVAKATPGKESPSKASPSKGFSEHHRVARIPIDGLAPVDLPRSLQALEFHLQVEAYRVMQACNLSPLELESQWKPRRSISSLHKLAEKSGVGKRFERGYTTNYKGLTLSAKLRWSKSKDGPLFELYMLPPRREDSTALQRKFGADRILVVDLPALDKPPAYAKNQDILGRLLEMFTLDQSFLGRRWVQYHVQDKKRKRAADPDMSQPGAYQVAFFAVSGPGLEDISIAEVLNWAVPFSLNQHQPACKAYARLDLAASRTRSTLTFEPSQFRFVRDQYAQNVPDDPTYNDPSLAFPDGFNIKKLLEMSDGCSEISVAAMRKIQLILGLSYLPSVVQARIFGAKGVWYRSANHMGLDCTPDQVWISIADSQVKARHPDQEDDTELRTLNVVNYSRPAKPSLLYPGFLPILRDRGVPAQAILDIARDQVSMQKEGYLACLTDIPELHRWVYMQKDLMGSRAVNNGIPLSAGFPPASDERLAKLCESGFKPTECAYMKKEVLDIGEYVFNMKAKQFRIRLNKSTSLIGICDPTGTLKPGEIHVAFSTGFSDEATGETWSTLHGLDVLVARNPSLRNSDIQKVRVVFRPELAHLQDVVVFSARGPRPLASKLSGGDYDGDTFWICWEKSLVQPFMNAPAPWVVRELERFGLTKDETTLAEVIYGPETKPANEHDQRSSTTVGVERPNAPRSPERHDSHTDLAKHANTLRIEEDQRNRTPIKFYDTAARQWIQRSTAARMCQQYLGTVTLLHGKLTYHEDDISSEKADLLVDLHDLLVDADKQGLRYDQAAYERFKCSAKIQSFLPEPAHRRFTGHTAEKEELWKHGPAKPNPLSIVDQLYFTVVEPEVDSAMKRARSLLKHANALDLDLVAPYEQRLQSSRKVQEELGALRAALQAIRETWSVGMRRHHSEGRKGSDWEQCIRDCRTAYVAIKPASLDNDAVVEWMSKRGCALTVWDEIKASALAKLQCGSGGMMMFSIAGGELCALKAQMLPLARTMGLDIYLPMKPHKRRLVVEGIQGGFQEDKMDNDDDDEEYDMGESIFDDFVNVDSPKKPRSTRSQKKRKSCDAADVDRDERRAAPCPPAELATSPPPSQWLVESPPAGRRSRTTRPEWY